MTANSFSLLQRDGTVQWRSLVSIPRGLQISVGYRRCLDFDAPDLPGQDFACVSFDGDTVVAVVADGVSQSFVGDIAARHVGVHLANALWAQRLRPPSALAVREALEQIRPEVDQEVQAFQFDRGTPGMVRAALEEARVSDGSQTCFSAVVVDVASRSAIVYLIGDVTVLTHLSDGIATPLEGDRRGRWSSLHGMRRVEVACERVSDLRALTVKSDGMGDDWGVDLSRVHDPDFFRQVAQERAAKDDMSFIAIDLQAAASPPPLRLLPLRRVASEALPAQPKHPEPGNPASGSRPVAANPSHAMHGVPMSTNAEAERSRPRDASPLSLPLAGSANHGFIGSEAPYPSALSSPSLIEDLVHEQYRRERPTVESGAVPSTAGLIGVPGIPLEHATPGTSKASQPQGGSAGYSSANTEADRGVAAVLAGASAPPRSAPRAPPRALPPTSAGGTHPASKPQASLLARGFRWLLGVVVLGALAVLATILTGSEPEKGKRPTESPPPVRQPGPGRTVPAQFRHPPAHIAPPPSTASVDDASVTPPSSPTPTESPPNEPAVASAPPHVAPDAAPPAQRPRERSSGHSERHSASARGLSSAPPPLPPPLPPLPRVVAPPGRHTTRSPPPRQPGEGEDEESDSDAPPLGER